MQRENDSLRLNGGIGKAEKDRAVARLKRIEGQIRGIGRMVRENRHGPDIIAQTHSAVSALRGLQYQLMRQHLRRCIEDSHAQGGAREAQAKIVQFVTSVSRRANQEG